MIVQLLRVLKHAAEAVTVLMMVAMFASIVYQVVSRYLLGMPVSWSMEVASILWVWIIFWAGALLVSDEEQIRVDLLYFAVPEWLRKVFAGLSAAIVIAALSVAFVPTLEFVRFMHIDYTPMLRVGYDVVFSLFLLFMICAVLRAGVILAKISRGRNPEDPLA